MSQKRDSQRQRVYDAEHKWRIKDGGRGILFWEGREDDHEAIMAEMQKYLDKVLGWKWTRHQFDYVPSRIVIKRGTNNQVRGLARTRWLWMTPEIIMPQGQRGRHAQNEGYLLHELAHHLAPEVSRHDHNFCQAFLKLVRRCQGQESHDLLLARMREHKVNW